MLPFPLAMFSPSAWVILVWLAWVRARLLGDSLVARLALLSSRPLVSTHLAGRALVGGRSRPANSVSGRGGASSGSSGP